MDVAPSSRQLDFDGEDIWWEYIWGCDERGRLEHLLVAALLNTDIRRRLLDHDLSLFESFHLSDSTILRICDVQAHGLSAFTAELLRKLAISPVTT